MDDALRSLHYDALTRQLERMRAMQYGYFSKFFSWIIFTGGGFVLGLLLPFPEIKILLPFAVITAGVQASFYLHFVDFARVHSRALEVRINALLEEDLLLGSRVEEIYFYPLEKPKFSGIILTRPSTFFSAYTMHWLFLWSFFFLFGCGQAWVSLPFFLFRLVYFLLLGAWLLLNSGYLAWYFIVQRDEKEIARLLHETYEKKSN